MTQRAELGIVAYSAHEVFLGSFSTFGELARWFDDVLGPTQVAVEIATVTRLPPYDRADAQSGTFLREFAGEGEPSYWPLPISTEYEPRAWMQHEFGRPAADGGGLHASYRPEPHAWIRMSGAEVLGVQASKVLLWSELRDSGAVGDPHPVRAGAQDAVAPGSHVSEGDRRRRTEDAPISKWIAIHLVGTDVAIVVPSECANLRIKVDDDGASVVFSSFEHRCSCIHRGARAPFSSTSASSGRCGDADPAMTVAYRLLFRPEGPPE